MNVNE
jgi:hypothetical protein